MLMIVTLFPANQQEREWLFAVERKLSALGIEFDTGRNLATGGRDWFLDEIEIDREQRALALGEAQSLGILMSVQQADDEVKRAVEFLAGDFRGFVRVLLQDGPYATVDELAAVGLSLRYREAP